MNFSIPTSQQIGFKMHKIAKISAIVLIFAFVILADLYILLRDGVKNFYEIAYTSGYKLGTWMHGLNDKLAMISVEISEKKWRAIASRFVQETQAPEKVDVIQLGEEFGMKTVKELRAITGQKSSKLRKKDLIAIAVEMYMQS